MIVLALDPRGKVQWVRQCGGAGDEGGNEVSIGPAGQIIVAAQSYGTFTAGDFTFPNTGWQDAYVVSINPNGTVAWVRSIEGIGSVRAKSIAVDKNGNVYWGGDFTGPNNVITPLGPVALPVIGQADAYMTSWTSTGSYRWSYSWGGEGNDLCKGVAVNAHGDVYMAGPMTDTVNFKGTKVACAGPQDMFVWKTDSLGNPLWLRHISSLNNVSGGEVVLDNHDGLLLGSGIDSAAIFEGSSGSHTAVLPPRAGVWPAPVRYNADGTLNEVKLADASQNGIFDELSRSGDMVYINVNYSGLQVYAHDTLRSALNNKDAGLVSATLTGSTAIHHTDPGPGWAGVSLYPNPVQNELSLNLSAEKYTVSISDIQGITVLTRIDMSGKTTIDCTGLKNGNIKKIAPTVFYTCPPLTYRILSAISHLCLQHITAGA
jgi:hypothetical protein